MKQLEQLAQDLCSYSKRVNRRIAQLCNCLHNAEDEHKDKARCSSYFMHVPKYSMQNKIRSMK